MQLDQERQTYGIKEKVLAGLYIKMLGLAPASKDAKALKDYTTPIEGVAG
jgi:hypothetical protein